MFRKEIHTKIEINASRERVWETLTDLASYPEWNPMIRRASGEIKIDARLELYFKPPGTKGTTFRPKLIVVEPNAELRWSGRPGVPKLFESEHVFMIEQIEQEKALLAHDMIFYGLLIPLVRERLEQAVRQPFDEMNHALKNRVEQTGKSN